VQGRCSIGFFSGSRYHAAWEHNHARASKKIARGPTVWYLWPPRRRWTGPKRRTAAQAKGPAGPALDGLIEQISRFFWLMVF